MNEEGLRLEYLARLGIEVWQPADSPVTPPTADAAQAHRSESSGMASTVGLATAATALKPADTGLTDLALEVAGCTRCNLHRTRNKTVFGAGQTSARCLLIGEGPGAEEDARGEPFVGRAGKLLNAMLAAIGIARESVYITNMVKCRPPNNRDPQADEISACSGYLRAQIQSIQPRLIVTLGRVAAQQLLGSTASLGKLRGTLHSLHSNPEHADNSEQGGRQIRVLATYHPAYLLRSPEQKAKVWVDLKKMRQLLEEDA